MIWKKGYTLDNGRYSIERKIGLGGFGITYLAKDLEGNLFAIKTLKDELLEDDNIAKLREGFKDEALKLFECRHPNIVRVETYFEEPYNDGTYEGKLPCVVMEYILGENLEQIVKKSPNFLEQKQALEYIRQIGEALIVIHNKYLLHRDVKPQNIMLRTQTSQVVLIDFGIARRFIPDKTIKHTEWRTDGYAPPEQYEDKGRWGAFIDIYALSATLYFLLTKNIPTKSDMRRMSIIESRFQEPKEINSSISDKVNQAILWGMKLESSERPQKIEDWLAALLPVVMTPQTELNLEISSNDNSLVSAKTSKMTAEDFYNQGENAYNLEDYDRAIADFNQAIKLDPNFALAYNERGNVYIDLKDYDRAITDFNQAIKLDPNYVNAYKGRGNVYYYLKDYERAIAEYNQAIKLDPNFAKAYYNRGLVYYYLLNDYDRAIAEYNQAIKLDPNFTLAYNERGLFYKNKGSKNLAVKDFKKVLELNDNAELSQEARQLLQELDTFAGLKHILASLGFM